jgi:hypothetical protein
VFAQFFAVEPDGGESVQAVEDEPQPLIRCNWIASLRS